MIYSKIQRIESRQFDTFEQRYPKDVRDKMSDTLKKLLSFSDQTETDLVKYLEKEQRKDEVKQCEQCKKPKFRSMNHCRKCNQCVLRYDHHCPWFNNCIGQHNIHYMLSISIYLCCMIMINSYAFFWYNDTEAYISLTWTHRIAYFSNMVSIYFTFGYTGALFILNSQGRPLYDMAYELMKAPSPPKYKLQTGWRENMFVITGSQSPLLSILLPYLSKPPLTGLEYSFVKLNSQNDDFWDSLANSMKQWLDKKYGKNKREEGKEESKEELKRSKQKND